MSNQYTKTSAADIVIDNIDWEMAEVTSDDRQKARAMEKLNIEAGTIQRRGLETGTTNTYT